MSNRIIKCQVANEFITGTGQVIGAAGSHDDVELELEFSPMWEGTSKRIAWFDALGENPVITILTTNLLVPGTEDTYRVPVPPEAKAVEGNMMLTIRGAEVENGRETRAVVAATAMFVVLPARWDPFADESQDVTPSQADQLQAQLENIKSDIVGAVDAAADAKAAAKDANDSRIAASVSAINADDAKTAAEKAVGKTSYIGENGNWFEWDAGRGAFVDSGVPATGPRGTSLTISDVYHTLASLEAEFPTGNENVYQVTEKNNELFIWSKTSGKWVSIGGLQGAEGKSAYQSAKEGGYNGTEAEFNAAMKNFPNHTEDNENPHGVTARQVGAAPYIHANRHVAGGEDPLTPGMIGAASNPNLLDNWYFGNPVDQKMGYVAPTGTKYYSNTDLATQAGTLAEYTTAQKVTAAYGKVMVGSATYYVPWSSAVRGYVCPPNRYSQVIDRWRGAGAYILVKDGFIQLQKTQTANTILSQILQIPPESMVTFSALVRAPEGVSVALAMRRYDSVPNQLETFVGNGDWQLVCIPFVRWGSNTECVDLLIRSYSNVGDTVDIKAAKLELGGVQTLAYQDKNGAWVLNEICNYSEQFARCQMYYQLFSSEDKRPTKLVDYRPAMRVNPAVGTISIEGETYYYADANY